jgi:hypothetical protein
MHARSVGQLLDLSVDLFVERFAATVGLAFLMWLPVRAFLLVFEGSPATEPIELQTETAWASGELELATVGLLSLAIQTLVLALTTHLIYAEIQGRRMGLRPPLMGALRRAPALLLMSGISTLGIMLGFFCCCVPGLVLGYLWSIAPAALVLEDLGPIASLKRSVQLVRQNFGRWSGLMGVVLLLKLPYDMSVFALDLPWFREWADGAGLPAWLPMLGNVLLTSLLLAISGALSAIALTVFYLDCRVRREGFDLAMRLERLQQAEAAPRARLP